MDVRGASVRVVPHAWERAALDILSALGGRGSVVRGRIRYDSDSCPYPHTPLIDGDGDPTFNDVCRVQAYWFAWVVAEDGEVYDPTTLFPELEPVAARGRTLVPFSPLLQSLLQVMAYRSWYYSIVVLMRMNADAARGRELDVTEMKPFGDVLMLPLLDRVMPSPFAAEPVSGGGLAAVRIIRKNELIGAFPVDALIMHSHLIREYASPASTAARYGFPMSDLDARDIEQARASIDGLSIIEMKDKLTSLRRVGKIFAFSGREPRAMTFYNCHGARHNESDFNAVKTMISSEDNRTVHVIVHAVREIAPGEEIVVQTDTLTVKAIEAIFEKCATTPAQEVYAFTNVEAMLDISAPLSRE